MNVKKGVKNIVYALIAQAVTLILGIIIPRLVIVSYGSEINGLLSSVKQVIGYLALLEAGVGAAALQALYRPISENDKESANSIIAATHHYYRRTGAVYLFLMVGLSFVYPLIISSGLNYWLMVGITFITGLPNVITYFFLGKLNIFLNAVGDNYITSNLSLITSTLASGAKILLLLAGANIIFVQTIYCVVSLIQLAFVFVYVKIKYPWVNVRSKPDIKALAQKNSTLIHQICGLVTHSTDTLVLSIFCSLEVASIYAVYLTVFNIIINVANSINGGVQFIFGQSFCRGREYYKRVIDTYETYYLAICSALLSVTYIMVLPFMSLYTAGADIDYIDRWLPLLFVGVQLFMAMRNSSANTISVAGHFKQTRNYAIIESAINLVVSLVLVNIIGIYGVLLGTIVAFVYRNIVSIHYSNKHILERSSAHSVKIIITNLLLMACFGAFAHLVTLPIDSYLSWVLFAIPVTAVAFIVFIAFNSIVSPGSFTYVKGYLIRKLRARKNRGVAE